ncbi:MAG: metallophosphoesterase, partial [Syntrophobacteraceae bacterium]
MRRRTFLKFGSSGLAGLALGGVTRTPIFQIGKAFAASTTAWKFGVLGDTQWTQHPNNSSTETTAQDPAGLNPNSVAVSIIDQVDAQFVQQGVKFVIPVGDLTDCGTTAAIKTRALAAQTNLYPHHIGFFPVRGNHETYGGGYGDLNPTSAVGTVKLLIFQNLRSKVVTTNCVFQIFAADSVLASA